MHVMMHVKT